MNYPLDELPFDTLVMVTDRPYILKEFEPTTPEEDLKSGKISRLVYWYPVYITTLYTLALNEINYKDYLDSLNTKNYWLFIEYFKETSKNLDIILEKSLNKNNLDEVTIKKSKLKLGEKK